VWAFDYQASPLLAFLKTIQDAIADAGRFTQVDEGNRFATAAWVEIFVSFYSSLLRVPSVGQPAEKLIARVRSQLSAQGER
jgi:hypothetical protein